MTAPALTPERRRTLEALVDRILPGIEGPGAAATAVAVAVERTMLHPHMRGLRPGLEKTLDLLDVRATELHARTFADCSPAEREDLVSALERDPNPALRFLLRVAIGLSIEGLLGDPVHGGNLEGRGWSAMGLEAEDVRSGLCRPAQEA